MMMIRRQVGSQQQQQRRRLIKVCRFLNNVNITTPLQGKSQVVTRRRKRGIIVQQPRNNIHHHHHLWSIKCHNFTSTSSSSSSNNNDLPPPPSSSSTTILQVREFLASEVDLDEDDDDNNQQHGGILYKATTTTSSDNNNNSKWEKVIVKKSSTTSAHPSSSNIKFIISTKLLSHFLPAKYPKSVAPEYLKFVSYCFTASVAGSAAMVLSTQTLLLAVGVVGSASTQQASIMAGALNWVMKDFIGQLGGVLFASQMGKTRAFDTDPKRWRMVSAMTLDSATLLEILSPLFVYSNMVLPIASIANISKNIGFLTASASRAALHSSVAISGNLGDVTAKSGSQSIMASLLGTSLGIGLSSLLSHDTYNFAIGFTGLAIIHQGCNYLSVKSVALKHFNRHRLHLLIDEYLNNTQTILDPSEIATKESFFPLLPADNTKSWLKIGKQLEEVYPNPIDLEVALSKQQQQQQQQRSSSNYLIRCNDDDDSSMIIYLNFMKDATGEDLIRGMFHSHLIRHNHHRRLHEDKNEENKDKEVIYYEVEEQLEIEFPMFLLEIQEKGWKTDTQVTTIESSKAQRLSIIVDKEDKKR